MEHYLTIGMVASGLFFGWTIGSHYTGATMGMAYGSGIIKKPLTACLLIAFFVILGAPSKVTTSSQRWAPALFEART